MKKEDFIKLGIDEETAKKCEAASTEELKGFIPKARFDEVNGEKKKLEGDLAERNTQLETLKNSTGDVDQLKEQIKTLQADNAAKDAAHAAEVKKLQRDNADNELLTAAKAKNNKAVIGLLEALDDGLDIEAYKAKRAEQLEAVKKSDAYLFDVEAKPNFKGAKPGEGSDPGAGGGVDFSKMTYSEMTAYLANNPGAKIE